jgi:hypothetical protein
LGFEVQEQPFAFPPGALDVLPMLGVGLVGLALLLLPLFRWQSAPRLGALLAWLLGASALGLLAWRVGTGLDAAGHEQGQDANLIATRSAGGGGIRRWIVAHVDTKAQGHSLAGRLVAIWFLIMAVAGLTILAIGRAAGFGPVSPIAAAAVSALALVAGVLAIRGRRKGGTVGARDNGTGLLAALVAAETARDPSVGFVFTGAEEFGLVGARAFVAAGAALAGTEIINLDTLTDRGGLHLVSHDRRGESLAADLAAALRGTVPVIRRRRLPLGILTDSLPLARAGARAVTISRLDWGTLRLVHTARDEANGLDLTTAETVGRIVGLLQIDQSSRAV